MRVAEHSVIFLVVAGKVLDRYALAVYRLDTLGVSSGTKSCNQRIFRIILKVSSAQRISVNIHSGCEPEIYTEFLHLFTYKTAELLDKIEVPGLCQSRSRRDHGAILVVIDCIFRCIFRERVVDKSERLAAS